MCASPLAIVPLLLLKGDPDRAHPPETGERPGHGPSGTRIRCPSCSWEAGPHDRWQCRCLHIWNTFDTRGVCPACGYKWLHTCCPRCMVWSLHEDWYVSDEPGATRGS